ncbi:phosphoglycerate mutase family protein [Necator americanus]|uniref:Phosphoglycerate mutase family protein n=1 Tax=Necator americanus TaxID=51031 RepID=W2SKH3_NECAM|nr:phosphoglycerate mutase family protein [Necator americanus]ETN70058.1 phosphoglycerate mutase family protein [Necator americanus]
MGAETSHLDYTPDPGPNDNNNNDNGNERPRENVNNADAGGSNAKQSWIYYSRPGDRAPPTSLPSWHPKYYNVEDIVNSDMDTMVDVTDKELEPATAISSNIGRKIAVVRHAESMNEAFPRWYSYCVSNDHYTAKDLNHPATLPNRSKGLASYNVDPPITQIAKHASRILGEALAKETSIKWDNVVSAPELASAQTAAAIAFSTTGDKAFINIDETLYDFSHGKIDFMTPMELMKYDITVKSKPMKTREEGESSVLRVLSEFEKVQRQYTGNLIVVVGPTAFDAVVHRLIGRERGKMRKRPIIPQLACVILEKGPESWKLSSKQVLPFRINSSASILFDPISYYSK